MMKKKFKNMNFKVHIAEGKKQYPKCYPTIYSLTGDLKLFCV